mgnify:CR=1 FL=1
MLPPEYVELEITESAYVEEYKVITGVAEHCEMQALPF